jgi:hypothetical protein
MVTFPWFRREAGEFGALIAEAILKVNLAKRRAWQRRG